jgi:hypothetical protein
MDAPSLRKLIQQTLQPLVLYSPAAEELLMATCAQESLLGQFRRQVSGPAIGIYQMEPADFADIWTNFLAYRPTLRDQIAALASTQPPRPIELQDNDRFSTAMTRVHYLRCPRGLPEPTDLTALWWFYRVNYNSLQGKATQEQFVANYKKYVNGPAV